MDEHGLGIREFLLGFVARDEVRVGSPTVHAPGGQPFVLDLRAELERHDEVCASDEVQPCAVLRLLAAPYASHPAYRPEWRLAPSEDPALVLPRVPDQRIV